MLLFIINFLFCGIKYTDIYLQLYMSLDIYEVYDKIVCICVSYGRRCLSTYSRKVKFERSHSIAEISSEASIIWLFITFSVIYLFGIYVRQHSENV